MLSLGTFLIIVVAIVSSIVAKKTTILHKAEKRIINEVYTLINEFPFYAEILYNAGGLHWTKGGTIISNRFILTSAYSFVTQK